MYTNTYPPAFARFYDILYQDIRQDDSAYFINQTLKTKGKVLEVGVGTGRHFIPSLDKGADIYGIDISENMLNVLRQKMDNDQHYRVSRQSITDFHFDFRFDLILAPFRVMQHLLKKEEQLEALNNVYRHLDPGGIFIFDLFIPDLQILLTGIHEQVDFEKEYKPGYRLRRTVSNRPEIDKQVINVNFRLEWDDEQGSHSEDWHVPLRYFFRYELEHLMERSGFDEYKIYGDFEHNDISRDSREFLIIGQRKKD